MWFLSISGTNQNFTVFSHLSKDCQWETLETSLLTGVQVYNTLMCSLSLAFLLSSRAFEQCKHSWMPSNEISSPGSAGIYLIQYSHKIMLKIFFYDEIFKMRNETNVCKTQQVNNWKTITVNLLCNYCTDGFVAPGVCDYRFTIQ
jgi:hypothetical protein